MRIREEIERAKTNGLSSMQLNLGPVESSELDLWISSSLITAPYTTLHKQTETFCGLELNRTSSPGISVTESKSLPYLD